MSHTPPDLLYTHDHEWLRRAADKMYTVGITHFAVEQLGDIVFVDLPRPGDLITKGQRFGTIESVKTVSDLYAPVSGRVAKVNAELEQKPELVNAECYREGWMIEVEPSDMAELTELMKPAAYEAHCGAVGA